ncbi:histone H1 [Dyadobacter sp. CY345]|uniref:histone H1 n=1 Tax=Dyadobacter sp. CY345 TaxID=2909335 RepID=UPI001F363FED|nr:histone H1 [Dyadobacter sp. CY345]MCF2444048.1 histone H1 [Dyadobacter sp. CY345]
MEKYEQIKQLVTDAEGDFKAFYEKGNKAAGTRVRGVMQQLKGLAQEIRAEVTEKKGESK